MKYKLIIFDFDGTLANSFPWFANIVNQLAAKYKFKGIEESEFETLRGYSARQLVERSGVPWWKLLLIARSAKRLMAQDINQIELFEGTETLLQRLSAQGVTLALVTSNSCDNVRRVLGPDIAALIEYYECGTSIFGKQAKFRKIVKKSGVPRSETLCIGDEIRDLEAARKEKLPFGAVSWGYNTVEALQEHEPEEVFASLNEIIEKVA